MTSQSTKNKVANENSHDASAQNIDNLSPSAFLEAYKQWATRIYGLPLLESEASKATIEKNWPFNLVQQSLLLNQQLWQNATKGFGGMGRQYENMTQMLNQNMFNLFAPANYLLNQSAALKQASDEGGKTTSKRKTSEKVEAIVKTGELVYENELMELMLHKPLIEKVHAEPILVVNAWILQHYLMDLPSQNALVKRFTEQGFSVFTVAWKNTDKSKTDYTMEDYRKLGIAQSLDYICEKMGNTKVHGLGLFLGGTLMTIAAAQMAKNNDERFKTLSVFGAQLDFADIAKSMKLTDKSKISTLETFIKQENIKAKQDTDTDVYVKTHKSAWPLFIPNYLLNVPNQEELNEAPDTNEDDTSYKKHAQFLNKLIVQNDFAKGRYLVDGKPLAITDIKVPTFVVDTERDHLTNWQSIYNVYESSDNDITFLLASGGYYTNIDDKPREPKRTYRVGLNKQQDEYLNADSWKQAYRQKQGSWWPELTKWLIVHSQKA